MSPLTSFVSAPTNRQLSLLCVMICLMRLVNPLLAGSLSCGARTSMMSRPIAKLRSKPLLQAWSSLSLS
ncbi:Uncharacterised protein [Vibrio cholerae]|nr:Uncharacterised protein [Vibrio cholerae]CSB56710.1 Uncharacterised protein [Vibrio cholerae]CSC81530.1 Uncharacterised protein [Vibrio cholerae]